MSDVFLSYARQDHAAAEALAAALEAQGLSVWWDRHIVAGHTFDEAIERELDSADSVVVLWSAASVGSEWVRSEASTAAERGVLIPVSIDGQRPPLEFRRKQTVSLADWRGAADHPGFTQLLQAARLRTAASTPPTVPSPAAPAEAPRRWPLLLALGAGLAVLVYGLFAIRSDPPAIPTQAATPPPAQPPATPAPAPRPIHRYRWQLVASNIDDDIYVEINAIERFRKAGGQATFDLTPYLTDGDDRVNVRLGNGNGGPSSLNVQFLRDGKPYGGTARHSIVLSHWGWQFDWEWIVNRSSGKMRRVK
ncbi:MAG: toll/interleukin-1 receptor domain-containing protein [Rhodocyclaceae bacterium]|nr:toll/interleukin-1 receptor domain-containing protein [Rhodocyclaceae bacterium]